MRGKTGEAEFDGGSHAWFAGYRGDMAFAALIVGGGSSEYAVRMPKQHVRQPAAGLSGLSVAHLTAPQAGIRRIRR